MRVEARVKILEGRGVRFQSKGGGEHFSWKRGDRVLPVTPDGSLEPVGTNSRVYHQENDSELYAQVKKRGNRVRHTVPDDGITSLHFNLRDCQESASGSEAQVVLQEALTTSGATTRDYLRSSSRLELHVAEEEKVVTGCFCLPRRKAKKKTVANGQTSGTRGSALKKRRSQGNCSFSGDSKENDPRLESAELDGTKAALGASVIAATGGAIAAEIMAEPPISTAISKAIAPGIMKGMTTLPNIKSPFTRIQELSEKVLELQNEVHILSEQNSKATELLNTQYIQEIRLSGQATSLRDKVVVLQETLEASTDMVEHLTDSLDSSHGMVQHLGNSLQKSFSTIEKQEAALQASSDTIKLLQNSLNLTGQYSSLLEKKVLLLEQQVAELLLFNDNLQHAYALSRMKGSLQEVSLKLAELKSLFQHADLSLELLESQESVYFPLLNKLLNEVAAYKKSLSFLAEFVKKPDNLGGKTGLEELLQSEAISTFHSGQYGFDETDVLNFLVDVLPQLYRNGKFAELDEAQDLMYAVAQKEEIHMPYAAHTYGDLYEIIEKYTHFVVESEDVLARQIWTHFCPEHHTTPMAAGNMSNASAATMGVDATITGAAPSASLSAAVLPSTTLTMAKVAAVVSKFCTGAVNAAPAVLNIIALI